MELTDAIRRRIKQQLTAHPRRRSKANARSYRFNNGRPYHSEALGVHPNQTAAASEHLRQHGVAVDFDRSGRAIIESEKQWQDVGRASNMFNGREGWRMRDSDGNKVYTGREAEKEKAEYFRQVVREIR